MQSVSDKYEKLQQLARECGIPDDYWCIIQDNEIRTYNSTKENTLKSHVEFVSRICDRFYGKIPEIDTNKNISEECRIKLVDALRNALTTNLSLIQVGHPLPTERIG